MKLSQSTQFVPRKSSRHRIGLQSQRQYKKVDPFLQPIRILIKINRNDELQPSFVDTFSKIIINNSDFDFQDSYGNIKTITYSQFYETLKNLGNHINRVRASKDFQQHLQLLKAQKGTFKKTKSYQNVRKGSVQILPQTERKNYVFCFEAHYNSIVLLIDLSPYMLLYDYSTKSFLLQNAEEIVRDLFVELERHYCERCSGGTGPVYFISCYIFSVYHEEIEEVIRQQQVVFGDSHDKKFRNRQLISDYICAYINKCQLPYSPKKDREPQSISTFIQRVLNFQHSNSGIKTIVTISAFKQLDFCPYVFFNSNWYTYCFLCAGQLNFGSFLIDDSQIVNRFSKSPYLETKFVYKCKFLENWQKVQLVEREGFHFRYLDSSVKKTRAILYISSTGQKKQSFFQDILKFNLKINERRRRGEQTLRSNDSSLGFIKNPQLLNQYQFNIPAENISEVMRTKYLQGWEQISTQNYPKNTKQYANKNGILYNATRTEDSFNVKVSYILGENDIHGHQDKASKYKKQIAQKIKRIDMINTSNFDIVTTFKNKNTAQQSQIGMTKPSKNLTYYLNFDSRGIQNINMLNEILNDHEQWNCYFKVRKIYIHFIPNTRFVNDLNQLLKQIGFYLGERISDLCFMQRKEKKEKMVDNIKDREVSRWHITFVKVSGIFQFLEFKFGFLKYSDNQIRQSIQNIENKLISKKLANGSIKLIPQQIYSYCIQKFDKPKIYKKFLESVFLKTWKVSLKNEHLSKVFKYMNNQIIRKLGYTVLKCKQNANYYYKILTINEKQNKKDKAIFLQICHVTNNSIQFKLQTFPSFTFIPSLVVKEPFSQNIISQKNLYHLTQKSISSSSNQFSISSSSLPLPNHQPIAIQPKQALSKVNQNQSQNKYKCSYLELFQILAGELKDSQKRAINLIKCYTEIYQALLKKTIQDRKTGIESYELIDKIKEVQKFVGNDFQAAFLETLQHIKREHFSEDSHEVSGNPSNRRISNVRAQQSALINQSPQINIDEIPQPSQYLTESPIIDIKGDLTITSKTNPDKVYKFFLLSPNRVLYLWKKRGSRQIVYRCMNNIYQQSSNPQKYLSQLKPYFQKQMINRINKQLKQQQYLLFYKVIAGERISSELYRIVETSQTKVKNEKECSKTITRIQKAITHFAGVVINCTEIANIICKEENSMLEYRMINVLIQYRKKFYQYLRLLYSDAHWDQQAAKQSKIMEDDQDSDQSLKQSRKNYFYEKKVAFESEEEQQISRIRKQYDLKQFESSVIKICTNSGIPVEQQHFISLFIQKTKREKGQNLKRDQEKEHYKKLSIHLNVFGFKTTKSSSKVRWLNEVLNQLTNQCIIYLKLMTVTEINQIKEIQNKFADNIIKGPFLKVPEDLWNQAEVIRQIESGQMRNMIPFHQYSTKPFPAKFISRQVQLIPENYLAANKPNQLFYLKYWLTLQITPAKVLKTKLIPFKHISLMTELKLNMKQLSYQDHMNTMIQDYAAELLKFLKIRAIFRNVQNKLMFPLDPPIPIFINQPIYKKLEEQRKKSLKIKVPKKFKHRPANYPNLQLKSLSFWGGDQTTSSISVESGNTPLMTPTSLGSSSPMEGAVPNLKNYFKLSLIYQGSISYFPKFQSSQIFTLLACCEKLNPYAIRNLENTYIFFNPELKQYFIFYLEEHHTLQTLNSDPIKTQVGSAFASTTSLGEKKKSNLLTYSVYCIDNTAPKQVIQKLHGGLIKKALEEVTFYKIAKILQVSHSVIDESQEQYFKLGQKQQLIFNVPHIQKKSNLNQYIKQHLQKAFHHKKTQFKSELKKNQFQKIHENHDIFESFNKDDPKISTRKRKKSMAHFQICQLRCVPQTWIFNTYEDERLQQIFGTCMFLTRIKIHDDFDWVQNAQFWKRHLKQQNLKKNEKVYIYPPLVSKEDQLTETFPNNEKLVLNFLQTYNEKDQKSKKNQSVVQQILGKGSEMGDKKQFVELIMQKTLQNNVHDVQNQTWVKFQIFSSFGFPRFNLIRNMYRQALFFGLYDYYLENRLFRQLFANFSLSSNLNPRKNSIISSLFLQKSSSKQSCQITGRQKNFESQVTPQNYKSFDLSLQRVESSPMKQTLEGKSFSLLCNDQHMNRIYLSFLDVFYTLEHEIPIKRTPCAFYYKTENKVLIEEKIPVLLNFIKIFIEDVSRHSRNDDKYSLRLIVYGIHKLKNETQFWGISTQKFQKENKKCKYATLLEEISFQIQKQGYQFTKMGFFFCDFLHDIDSIRQTYFEKYGEKQQDTNSNFREYEREWETFNRTNQMNIQFDWMKKLEEGRSFCQNQYLFKRSLLLHFQISDFQFMCYAYNFKDKQLLSVYSHLEEMQIWFYEKYRLYTFICRLKKQQQEDQPFEYEIPAAPSKQSTSTKTIFITERELLNRDSTQSRNQQSRQSETNETDINLTKLLKSLSFDQLPFKNFMKSRAAIEKMYRILSSHTVPYCNYPEYKGKQKGKLAKIAREYLSIIRHYFGVEKPIRKESSVPIKNSRQQLERLQSRKDISQQ